MEKCSFEIKAILIIVNLLLNQDREGSVGVQPHGQLSKKKQTVTGRQFVGTC